MSCRNPRLMLLFALLLIAATLIGACGEKDEPDPADAYLEIGYHKGGGVAGIDRRLEISPAGDARVSVNGSAFRAFEAEPELVARAQRATADIDFGRLTVPAQDPTPDAFTISLSYGSDTVAGDESRILALDPLRPAVSALDAILEEAPAEPPSGSGPG